MGQHSLDRGYEVVGVCRSGASTSSPPTRTASPCFRGRRTIGTSCRPPRWRINGVKGSLALVSRYLLLRGVAPKLSVSHDVVFCEPIERASLPRASATVLSHLIGLLSRQSGRPRAIASGWTRLWGQLGARRSQRAPRSITASVLPSTDQEQCRTTRQDALRTIHGRMFEWPRRNPQTTDSLKIIVGVGAKGGTRGADRNVGAARFNPDERLRAVPVCGTPLT
jgi:hypothetical protein